MARGHLRIYLGAAAGVGKTYAMLAEGQRRSARGTDLVIAFVETHGRRLTRAMAEGLESVPRRPMTYRGAAFTEMDTDAVLSRRPQVALVDELAHTNVPGSRNAKRWQDVEELLDAGIDVITTLNIQHLESLSDVAAQVAGVEQRERIPDEVARRADQIELVDMTPDALRRRMVHGNVYPPDRIEAALTHYFRPGNLTALRELALLWLADRVDEGLQRYRAEHGIADAWETRERVVVGIAGDRDEEAVIRHAARIASRIPGAELLGVHVDHDDGLADGRAATLAAHRALVISLGGSYRQAAAADVADALLEVARAENATQIVVGASYRGRLAALALGEPIAARLVHRAGPIDIRQVGCGSDGPTDPAVPPGRAGRHRVGSARHQAACAQAEAAALTRLAASVLRGHGDLPSLLEEIREMFGLAAVSLLERQQNGTPEPRWFIIASAGDPAPERPGADVDIKVSETVTLTGCGRVLSPADKQVLFACTAPLAVGFAPQRAAHHSSPENDRPGGSGRVLLGAADQKAHSLLAQADEAVAELGQPGHALTADERAALCGTAHRALGLLGRLLADMGDLTRLHAGAVETYLRPVGIDEVVESALDDLGPGGRHIVVRIDENTPDVITDAALLSRMLTSLMADSLHRSPSASTPVLTATRLPDRVEIHIADHHIGQPGSDGAESVPLRLARDLARAMGHRLRCEQAPDGSRTVIITVPAAATESRAPAASHMVTSP
jgi:two-component system, OmpR family, sensor histidine kinase KdpD